MRSGYRACSEKGLLPLTNSHSPLSDQGALRPCVHHPPGDPADRGAVWLWCCEGGSGGPGWRIQWARRAGYLWLALQRLRWGRLRGRGHGQTDLRVPGFFLLTASAIPVSSPAHCCLPLLYLVLVSASLFLPASLRPCPLSLNVSSFSMPLRASWDFCFGTPVLYLHMPFGLSLLFSFWASPSFSLLPSLFLLPLS